jgi:hypothetical protein
MWDLSDFERVGACLAGASVTKTATLLGVSRVTVCNATSVYTNDRKTTSAKRNSGWKSTLTERDHHLLRRIMSKNHRTDTAQVTEDPNIHLEDPVSTKLSDVKFTNRTSTVGLQLLNLWVLKVMLSCVNDGATTIKPGHQTTGNACMIWSYESSFTLFSTSGRVYIWRSPKEAYNPECLAPAVKHGGGSMMVWAAVS